MKRTKLKQTPCFRLERYLTYSETDHFSPALTCSSTFNVVFPIFCCVSRLFVFKTLKQKDGKATACVCENCTCSLPENTVEGLEKISKTKTATKTKTSPPQSTTRVLTTYHFFYLYLFNCSLVKYNDIFVSLETVF